MAQQQTISVVVPYYNEHHCLSYLLDQLAAQTLPPTEVILVNSSSTDHSSKLIDEWISTNQQQAIFTNLETTTNTPGGSKSAGIAVARGELLAFMDCGLTFPAHWLESQLELLSSTGADWVSGVCLTTGASLVDKCAIAHTYGYRSARAVIPSSLVRRSVFARIGTFRNLRAGYDAEWARASKLAGLRREINSGVIVEYQGVNFAKDLRGVFMKSLRYARPSVGRNDTVVPLVYVLAAVVALVIAALSPVLLAAGFASYVLARLVIAFKRSREPRYFLSSPARLLTLITVGLVMDFGKLCGFATGFVIRYICRRTLVR